MVQIAQPCRYNAIRGLLRSNYNKFGKFVTENRRLDRYSPYVSRRRAIATPFDESSYVGPVPFNTQLHVSVQ